MFKKTFDSRIGGGYLIPLLLSCLIFLNPFPTAAQGGDSVTLSGTVISSTDNQPIIGATVFVEGTTLGVMTDIDGNYSITVPSDTKALTFSCMGYVNQEIKLGGSNVVFKLVTLDESTQVLADAVVVAFGTTQRKETMVTSVETIEPDLLKTPTSTLSGSFAGNIAGVISTQSSGEPGADGANFYIRGIATFGANKTPIYILDGVEVPDEILNSISPESIESFSVLKDAAATALYGSRGANGVMIITTKAGRVAEKMTVNVNVSSTVNMPTKVPEIADGVTYMNLYNEARTTRGMDAYWSEDKIAGTAAGLNPYIYPNIDWYDVLFRDFGTVQNANINVRGGGKRVDYFLNASANIESGMMRNADNVPYNTNNRNQKYSFQSNVTAKITNTTVASVKLNMFMQYLDRPIESSGTYFFYAMRANPVTFYPVYPSSWLDEADFTVYGNAPSWDGQATDVNPYAQLAKGYRKMYTQYATASLKVDQDLKFITPGLKIWGQVSFFTKTFNARYFQMTPHYYHLTNHSYDDVLGGYEYELSEIGTTGNNYLSTSSTGNGNYQLIIQGNLEYNRTFGKHTVGAVALYHQKETVDTRPADYYAMLPKREQGLAGRVSYSYDDRYLIEGNFGYNGSENFIAGQRWGFFPSVAAGWIVSKEKFFKPVKNWFTFFKLRYSYGLAGNDYLSTRFPYVTQVTMNTTSGFYKGDNFVAQKKNTPKTIGNENATWELSRKHDVGLELGFFDELTIIADFFSEYRTGIFMKRQTLPSYTGLEGVEPYGNLGEVINYGFDGSFDYHHVFSKDLSITARGTFTYAHNEVVAMDESEFMKYPYASKVGKDVNSIYGLVAVGLFKDEEDIANSPVQTYMPDYKPGDIKYKDLNGDGRIDDNDKTWLGYTNVPEIIYGFGGTLNWKNLDLSLFFQGRSHVTINMSNIHPFRDSANQGFNIMEWIVKDHWSESNPNVNASYPRLDYRHNANNIETSTYWMRDGSFLRLKNLELGYTFKDFARVYVSGTNLFTISPFKYWDPELGSGNGLSYPTQRTVQLGVQFNFR